MFVRVCYCLRYIKGNRFFKTLPAAALQEKDDQRSDVAEERHRKQQEVGDGVGAVLERIVVMETRWRPSGGVVPTGNGCRQHAY